MKKYSFVVEEAVRIERLYIVIAEDEEEAHDKAMRGETISETDIKFCGVMDRIILSAGEVVDDD